MQGTTWRFVAFGALLVGGAVMAILGDGWPTSVGFTLLFTGTYLTFRALGPQLPPTTGLNRAR